MKGVRGGDTSIAQGEGGILRERSDVRSSELLRHYCSCEASRIKEAYNACNFTSLRDLPDKLKAGEVAEHQKRKVFEAVRPRLGVKIGAYEGKRWSMKGGLFQRFEYVPERYSLAEEAKAKEKARNEELEFCIGQGRKFAVPGMKKTLKHEDCFLDDRPSFRYDADPYEALQNEQSRERWIEQSRVLFGPFIPVGRAQSLTEPSRALLPQMTRALVDQLESNWAKHLPQVHLTDKETIAVRFETDSLHTTVGVTAFMNNLEANDPGFLRYKLRKIPGQWGMQPGDGYL